jgi:polyhydroxyalkanoate synthesis regulator phasin
MPLIGESDDYAHLVEYLVRTTRLKADEARKVIDEVTGFMNETVAEYVQRRHRTLQQRGEMNADIYARLARELREHRFRADNYSERQIRRLIYG